MAIASEHTSKLKSTESLESTKSRQHTFMSSG